MLIRLQKFLSNCGFASRRKAEQLILDGQVKINGIRVSQLGVRIDPEKDAVTVKGSTAVPEKKIYVLINKPRGILCTMKDEWGRQILPQILHNIKEKLFHVGRLDKDSEGLILMTNDGDFAQQVSHPSKQISKTYLVEAKGTLSLNDISNLRQGVFIDGRKTLPAKIQIKKQNSERIALLITIHEGRNRQIRKMLQNKGLNITRLVRIQIGNIFLHDLPSGHFKIINRKAAQNIFE